MNERYQENKSPDFDKLKAINPEIIAWIRVDNTNIDYPICQSHDNSKYISKRKYNTI